jgi:16S rRNA G966 N2-methylase RsmD
MAGIAHVDRALPPRAHTALYCWHKYWSRKTWNVVGAHVRAYCPAGGVVLDPFAGSGVVAVEALRAGRRALVCDLSPVAAEITRLTLTPVDTGRLRAAFERVAGRARERIEALYLTRCRACGGELPLTCAIWQGRRCVELRYKRCPRCGDQRRGGEALDRRDRALLLRLERAEPEHWYPAAPLVHANGRPFRERQRYRTLAELFSRRNLHALATLMAAIEQEPDGLLRGFLGLAFSSMVHLCTRMCPISEGGHFTPFSSAWTQHSYWTPSGPHMEQNVWLKFESALLGHQGLLRAKQESNRVLGEVRLGRTPGAVLEGRAEAYVGHRSCQSLLRGLRRRGAGGGSVDYVFTDPPYGGAVQYGELSYLWAAWLRLDDGYLERLQQEELVESAAQGKSFGRYRRELGRCFVGLRRAVKPGGYLTVTFHNPTSAVRRAAIRAGVEAGLELQHVFHQPLARPSVKSLLQPFGSARGDFYLRFCRSAGRSRGRTAPRLSAAAAREAVVAAALGVIRQRGQPTPFTELVDAVDPALARLGYFAQTAVELDVARVLREQLGRTLQLVPARRGAVRGQLWWLADRPAPRLY